MPQKYDTIWGHVQLGRLFLFNSDFYAKIKGLFVT